MESIKICVFFLDFLDGPSLMLVDPMDKDFLNSKDTKAFKSLLEFMDTDFDQNAAEQMLVRIINTLLLLLLTQKKEVLS